MIGRLDRFKAKDLYLSASTPAILSADIAVEFFFAEYTFTAPDPPIIESSTGFHVDGLTTLVMTKPAGLAVGDLLLAYVVFTQSATGSPTLPSGWATASGGSTAWDATTFAGTYVAWKIADSGDVAASDFTFTSSGGSPYSTSGIIRRITGADGTAPIDVASTQVTASGSTGNYPSVTTTGIDRLILLHSYQYTGTSTPSASEVPFVAPVGTTISATATFNDGTNNEYLGSAYFTQVSAGATGAKTATVDTISSADRSVATITVAIKPAATGVTLTPSLFTNSQTFYGPTVTPGSVTLTPSLFTNTNTFYAPTVSQGGSTQDLTPGLLTNTNSFFNPTVTPGSVTLTPSLFTNSNTFYGPTVTVGAVSLAPTLLTNSQTFYGPTITVGSVTLAPSLLTNTQTFYGPTVSQSSGTQTLTPDLLTNTSTFYAPTITTGSVTLTPSLFTNTNTLYAPTVTPGAITLSPSLLTNSNTFYDPTVTPGAVTLSPGLLVNDNEFYSPTLNQPSLQTLTPGLLTNVSVFYGPTANQNDPPGTYPLSIDGGGTVVLGGFGGNPTVDPDAIDGGPTVISQSLTGGGSVVAGSIPSTGRVVAGYLRGRP